MCVYVYLRIKIYIAQTIKYFYDLFYYLKNFIANKKHNFILNFLHKLSYIYIMYIYFIVIIYIFLCFSFFLYFINFAFYVCNLLNK